MPCGTMDHIKGGIVEQSTVVNSTVQGSTVTDSVVNAATLTNLSSIDEASAKKILDAMVSLLDASSLQRLADALEPLLTASTTKAPDMDKYDYLPDQIAGSATALLGKPDVWLEIGGQKVPAYD